MILVFINRAMTASYPTGPSRRSPRAVLSHQVLRICSLTHWHILNKELRMSEVKELFMVKNIA